MQNILIYIKLQVRISVSYFIWTPAAQFHDMQYKASFMSLGRNGGSGMAEFSKMSYKSIKRVSRIQMS